MSAGVDETEARTDRSRLVRWVRGGIPLPAPPDEVAGVRTRRGPFAVRWNSPIHSTKVAAWLGMALGISFGICFITGLLSHAFQNGVTLPSRPVDLYRVTQGVHIVTGVASVPLLLAKLASVYPRFWGWPPAKSVLTLLERGALGVLVGGAIFQLSSGVFNIANWYPFGFFFTDAHYAVGWLTIGALIVHVAVKITLIRQGLGRGSKDSLRDDLREERELLERARHDRSGAETPVDERTQVQR